MRQEAERTQHVPGDSTRKQGSPCPNKEAKGAEEGHGVAFRKEGAQACVNSWTGWGDGGQMLDAGVPVERSPHCAFGWETHHKLRQERFS